MNCFQLYLIHPITMIKQSNPPLFIQYNVPVDEEECLRRY